MTCRESVSLGAYLLGALSPEDRMRMERHIAGCPSCQSELVQLAPLPGLLRHTPFEELPETASAAEAVHTPAREARAPVEPDEQRYEEPQPPSSRSHRRPRRRTALAAAALGIAAAAGAGIYAGVSGVGGTGTPSATSSPRPAAVLTATDPTTHVAATAALTPETWGTWMKVDLRGLPSGVTCHMVVHARDGRAETAGTWGSGYTYDTTVPASTSISPQDISSLVVLDGSGHTLVTLPQ